MVVLGILIALQVNTWNQDRKLKALENSYYLNILDELKSDSLEYQRKWRNAGNNITKLNNISRFIKNGYDISKIHVDTVEFRGIVYEDTLALVFSASQAGFLQFPQIYPNTITDLRSTGNMKILQNESLKKDILEYYSMDNLYKQWVDQLLPARVKIEKSLNSILNERERIAYNLQQGLQKSDLDYESFVEKLKLRKDFSEDIIGMLHVHHRIRIQCTDRIGAVHELMEKIRLELTKD